MYEDQVVLFIVGLALLLGPVADEIIHRLAGARNAAAKRTEAGR